MELERGDVALEGLQRSPIHRPGRCGLTFTGQMWASVYPISRVRWDAQVIFVFYYIDELNTRHPYSDRSLTSHLKGT